MHDPAARFRNDEIWRRVSVTLAALAVFQVGCWIPLPGVDARPLLSGNGFAHVSLMALGATPLLSAVILAEALLIVLPKLRTRLAGDPSAALGGWLLPVALAIAALQANGIAAALERMPAIVTEHGLWFRFGVIASMVAATAVVAWLATVVTRHGLGWGLWIFVAVRHVVSLSDSLRAEVFGAPGGNLLFIVGSIGFLALSVALLAALWKAKPSLAFPEEAVWACVLGGVIATWLVSLVALVLWLAAAWRPDAADARAFFYGAALLPAVTVPLVVALRRRSLGAPCWPDAAPLAMTLAVLVALGTAIAYLPPRPLLAIGPGAMLTLAAVGLLITSTLQAGTRNATTPPRSS